MPRYIKFKLLSLMSFWSKVTKLLLANIPECYKIYMKCCVLALKNQEAKVDLMNCCGLSCLAFLAITGYVHLTGGLFPPYICKQSFSADFKIYFVIRHSVENGVPCRNMLLYQQICLLVFLELAMLRI